MSFRLVLVILFYFDPCKANTEMEASKKALEAWYAGSETKIILENKIEIYKEKIPKDIKNNVEIFIPLLDTIIKQKVEWKYEF